MNKISEICIANIVSWRVSQAVYRNTNRIGTKCIVTPLVQAMFQRMCAYIFLHTSFMLWLINSFTCFHVSSWATLNGPGAHFHEQFFLVYSNSMENWFNCNSIVRYHIATKFCTSHAHLPCHVQNILMITVLHLDESRMKVPSNLNCDGKNFRERPPDLDINTRWCMFVGMVKTATFGMSGSMSCFS